MAVGVKFDKFSTLSYKGPKVTLATEREREMERERERRKKWIWAHLYNLKL